MDYIPDNVTDCIANVELELEKAWVLSSILVQEYPFDEQPDNSTLIWGYKRMAVFMDFVNDCIYKSNKYIEKAMEIDREQRKKDKGADTNG